MGLDDRHYVRSQPRGGGAGAGGGFGGGGGPGARGVSSMRAWSVNTWIIVACVAVFMIDGFLPQVWVEMDPKWVPELVESGRTPSLADVQYPQRRDPPARGAAQFNETLFVLAADGTVVPAGARVVQSMHLLQSWLHFSTSRGFLHVEFWRLVGFQFLHGSLSHLLFNMIGLFFFGGMVERYLGSKRYFAFYLLCGIFGALMYVLLNLGGLVAMQIFGVTDPIPGLIFNDASTPLIGASAGVFGVLMAGAYMAPNVTVLLFMIIPMKLRTLAYGLVAVALFVVVTGGNNAGGEAGHLGGALAGFYFIRRAHHLHGFFDFLGRVDPTSHHYRKGRGTPRFKAISSGSRPNTDELDRVLAKVKDKGLHSLTRREERVLRNATDRE